MITTYIFDLDDTIIDNIVYKRMYREFIENLVKDLKISEIELQQTINKLKQELETEKPNSYEIAKKLNSEEIYYKILEKYIKFSSRLKLIDTPKIFRKIKKNKKKIGVVSNAPKRTVDLFLKHFSLEADFVESGNKYSVLFWITVQKKNELDMENTLVIDNSDEILEVAKHSGYKVLNVVNLDLEKFAY